MAQDPVWGRIAVARPRQRAAGPIAGILFVGAMGAAFWLGALWASQPWWHTLR
jgi:hypothetical protein